MSKHRCPGCECDFTETSCPICYEPYKVNYKCTNCRVYWQQEPDLLVQCSMCLKPAAKKTTEITKSDSKHYKHYHLVNPRTRTVVRQATCNKTRKRCIIS